MITEQEVRDIEDIASMPSGAVVMSEGGLVWQNMGGSWFAAGHAEPYTAVAVTLPAKVLFPGNATT